MFTTFKLYHDDYDHLVPESIALTNPLPILGHNDIVHPRLPSNSIPTHKHTIKPPVSAIAERTYVVTPFTKSIFGYNWFRETRRALR